MTGPRVRVYLGCSLDGCIAGPEHDISFLNDYTPPPGTEDDDSRGLSFEDFLDQIGALLMGRRTYQVPLDYDAWHYGDRPVLVATHHELPPAPKGGTARAVQGPIEDLIAQAKQAAGQKDVYLDGGDLVRQALDAGLVDELCLTVLPLVLGRGIRLGRSAKSHRPRVRRTGPQRQRHGAAHGARAAPRLADRLGRSRKECTRWRSSRQSLHRVVAASRVCAGTALALHQCMDPRAERFFRAVLARSGFADRAECEPAIRAVLAPLGTRLSDDDLAAVSEELPHAVAAYLDRRARSEGPASDFVADVADAEGIDVGFAREHAGVVLTALCDQLSPNAQTILRGAVEPEFRSLFERREPTDKMTPRHDGRSSLASGKAGSAHPVSEYGRDRSQSRSVVQSDNPHGDTKLSSSEGTTQEREDETLAEGRPPRGLDR